MIQTILYIFFLFQVSFAIGQIINSNSKNELGKPTSMAQFGSLNETVNKLDDNIRCIYQDKKGNYWFGSNGAGVYRYDSKVLIQYTVKDGLANNQVLAIQEDDWGNLWFSTGVYGISKFDGTKFTTLTMNVKITSGTEADWKSINKYLWFFGGSGAFRYSNSSLDYLPFDSSNANARINNPFSLSRFGVYSILKDRIGNVWFGTQAEGVSRYDGRILTWFKDKGLSGPAVLGIFEDSKGNLWFGNNGSGLYRYDGTTLRNITEENGLSNPDFRAHGKPGLGTLARVYSINEDKYENIWVGTVDAGVWKYDGKHLINYTTQDGLGGNAVNTIYKDKNGELWFGTDQNGIYKYNGNKFTKIVIK